MIDNQARWTEVSGSPVHYDVEGMEQGNPVVLLHGASFSAETWNTIGTMKVLAQAGFLAYAVDLPGFGKSAAGQGSPRTWLKELLDLLEINRPVIVSPSMSGRFALPLVTEESQRVSGWVAVAPVGIVNYKDQLKNITAPVLAVWGEHDRVVPLEQADLLVRSVKQGRKVIIPGGSHAPYMSDPAAFHAELLKFLADDAFAHRVAGGGPLQAS
jgi:abhydrolase domain-containing protein 14